MHTKVLASLMKKKLITEDFEFILNGKSMFPTLKPGDKVMVKKQKDINVGNIVCFINASFDLTAHRVLKISKEGALLKGDNTLVFDPIIPLSDIIGTVYYIKDQELISFDSGLDKKIARKSYLEAKVYAAVTSNIIFLMLKKLSKTVGIRFNFTDNFIRLFR